MVEAQGLASRMERRRGHARRRCMLPAVCIGALFMNLPAFGQNECANNQRWPTTDWVVQCTSEVEREIDYNDYLMKSDLSSEIICSNGRENTPVSVAGGILENGSAWLSDLCFLAPVVGDARAADGLVNQAFLSRKETDSLSAAGVYDNGELHVSYDHFVETHFDGSATMGEGFAGPLLPGDAEVKLEATDQGKMTLVHELFHAIQAAYPIKENDDPLWIIEGTAEAVEIAWAMRRGWTLGDVPSRFFDDPLHRPRSEEHAYMTSAFWLWLGEIYGSEDRVGYLHEMLQTGSFEADGGLHDFETFLRKHFSTRLFEVFPKFIARRANKPALYSNGKRETRIRYREPEAKKTHSGRVRMVAADPVTVRAEVPDDAFAEIEIRVRETNPDLHLIVDDLVLSRSEPADSATAEQRSHWAREHNRFVAPVGGGAPTEFFVRVAYAKPDHAGGASAEMAGGASRSRDSGDPEPKDYVLDIKLVPLGTCDFSASIAGDANRSSARGNVAHFSTSGGATIQGLLGNRGNAGAMSEMLDAMTGGRMTDDERREMDASARAWEREVASMPQETLGLSLIEMDTTSEGEAMLAAALGGFKLQASVFDQPIEPGFRGGLNPGHIVVHTGDMTESYSQMIRFEWAPGTPGNASLEITQYTENLMTGTLNATLTGQGVYDTATGEPPQIDVSASFRAVPHNPLRGELGCAVRNDQGR